MVMMTVGSGRALLGGAPNTRLPAQIIMGAAALGYWDMLRSDLVTLNGAQIVTWTDIIGGYQATQAVSSARPLASPAGFNGGPAANFDGTDDELTLPSVPFPVGASPCNIYLLVDQTAIAADATTRYAFSYGNLSAERRSVGRLVGGGINRAVSSVSATNASNTAVDFSGKHVLVERVTATDHKVDVDGLLGGVTAVVPATTSVRVRIGALPPSVAVSFWQGLIAAILITDGSETQGQIDALTNNWKARGGIT